ncbi:MULTISPECIES: flagellar basal body rod protein FlgB [Planococcus]|uniref:Flagellar basal body rod protein FlgB n=1 Tax=Planococcus faecalis TaxID=1598147 RepID=A0ABN4XDT8_9BACL|nr:MULTISPECIES: flagellar basal body rod protein FlgB [Planococcus]AQU77986.1 flagellar basal body rod protein FlgB [Planococcus faecalis]MDJ0331396.1 flagellar basal body rod protein FlgB [Planococcus sp. S3-L1]OHX52190.1 flagellar basal body rod protein FlgB [Planococcus faecalis]
MNIFPKSLETMEQALSASTLKQRVHSANIANVDTANYKSKKVDFQAALDTAMNQQSLSSYKTDNRHLSFSNEATVGSTKILTNNSTQYNNNGNNVDMDVEMAELAKNQLWYNAVTERVNGKLNSLSSVINGGR